MSQVASKVAVCGVMCDCCVVCGVWCVACGVWQVVCGVVCDLCERKGSITMKGEAATFSRQGLVVGISRRA